MAMIPPAPTRPPAPTAGFEAELLEFPARHLPELPVGVRIVAQAPGFHHEIELTSGSFRASRERLGFDGEELRALALGAEAERVFPADIKGYCLLKLHEPSFRVTEELALGGVEPPPGRGWSLGRVLQALELQLVETALVDEQAQCVRLDAHVPEAKAA